MITGGATGTTVTLLGRNQLQGLVGHEPLAEDQRRTLAKHLTEHGVEAVHVEQRQNPEDDVVGGDRSGLGRGGLVRCSPATLDG